MIQKSIWDSDKKRLLPQNAQHEAIEQAVQTYFMQAQVLRAQQNDVQIEQEAAQAIATTLSTLQGLLSSDVKEYSYQKALILQLCNDILDAEGMGLALACAEQGQAFVCACGCVGCCHQLVLVLPHEAWLIAAFLREHTEAREAFLATWPSWHDVAKDISQSYLKWGEAFYGEGKDDKSHSRDDYYIPCPFLDTVGACSIYAVRPYACRSSVAVDVRCMRGDEKGKKGMYNMLFSLYTGHDGLRGQLEKHCFTHADDFQKRIMPYAVKELL